MIYGWPLAHRTTINRQEKQTTIFISVVPSLEISNLILSLFLMKNITSYISLLSYWKQFI